MMISGNTQLISMFSSGEFCVGISLAKVISGSAASRRFTRSSSGKMPVL